MVEELLAARGITVSYATVRQWALKFGQSFAHQIRRLPTAGNKWHLDEVAVTIAGKKALALVSYRPGWLRTRHPGAEPAGQTGR